MIYIHRRLRRSTPLGPSQLPPFTTPQRNRHARALREARSAHESAAPARASVAPAHTRSGRIASCASAKAWWKRARSCFFHRLSKKKCGRQPRGRACEKMNGTGLAAAQRVAQQARCVVQQPQPRRERARVRRRRERAEARARERPRDHARAARLRDDARRARLAVQQRELADLTKTMRSCRVRRVRRSTDEERNRHTPAHSGGRARARPPSRPRPPCRR